MTEDEVNKNPIKVGTSDHQVTDVRTGWVGSTRKQRQNPSGGQGRIRLCEVSRTKVPELRQGLQL